MKQTSFPIQTLILHQISFEGRVVRRARPKRHPCLGRPAHAMIVKQESNKNTLKKQMLLL